MSKATPRWWQRRGARIPTERLEIPLLVRRYDSLLPHGDDLTVVLLADSDTGEEIQHYLAHYASARVYVVAGHARPEWQVAEHGAIFRKGARVDRVHEMLTEVGPIDLLVDLRTAGTNVNLHARLWRMTFFHLRQDGVYAVRRAPVSDDEAPEPLVRRLQTVARHVGVTPELAGQLPDDTGEWALAVKAIVIAEDFVIVQKRNDHVLKVRDEGATILLRHRERSLSVTDVAMLPPGSIATHVASYDDPVDDRFENPIVYPRMHLRRYEGSVAVMPRGLAVAESSVLPISYRFHLAEQLEHTWMDDSDEWFGRIRLQNVPQKALEGSYYHFDYANPGHFGHLTTEALSKLWGWDQAKAADPDLKLLYGIGRTNQRAPRLETEFLTAYGIDPDDIVVIDEPVWVESLVGATPMWHNVHPYYVHPGIAEVWDRVGRGLASPDTQGLDRVFVSRPTTGNRPCKNTAEVEQFFADAGFTVLRPEHYSLREQAAIFATCRTVAGFGGSGMFNLMYARNLETMIVLNGDSYEAQNEYLFAAVQGAHAHYFWGVSDEPTEDAPRHAVGPQVPWWFDLEHNRSALAAVL